MSEMTREALELLQTTAQQAQAAVKIDLPGDGRTAYVSQGGALRELKVPTAVRNHIVRRLDDLIDMANRHAEADNPVIWHDQKQVTLIVDDDDRRDRAVFPLESTSMFLRMLRLEAEEPLFSQQQLIRLLRVEFELDSAKIGIFRRIDWTSSRSGQGVVEHGKESLGRSIEQQVKGAQEIPESIVIPISLYRNRGEDQEYPIRCLVNFDIDQAAIQIIPAPGELDHSLHAHQMNIRSRLEEAFGKTNDDSAVRIYFGTP